MTTAVQEVLNVPTPLSILVVDDEPDMVSTIHDLLTAEGDSVMTAYSPYEALDLLHKHNFDLILTDLSMPEMDGVALLKEAKNKYPDTEIMVITGYGTITSAVEAMKSGALNYLIKPVEPNEILYNVNWVRTRLSLKSEHQDQHRFHNLIGKSLAMRKIFKAIPKMARVHGSVLIQGESGVGKELVAQAIHLSSSRSGKRFVPIDCGALSDTLLESELFGHKQGSFTGSTTDRVGMIESANGGTLFLDEVGNASGYLQSRLLRVIEEKKVRKIGDNNMHPVNVRVLAASNEPLNQLVEENRFREDLFYRLSGFIVEIPPLRERIEDIPLLASHFLEQNAKLYDDTPAGFAPEAMEALINYPWPGNVRELRTVVDRAVAFAEKPMIQKRDIQFNRIQKHNGVHEQTFEEKGSILADSFYEAVEDFEKKYLKTLLETANGNISQASSLSGASRKTIREKGKKYGLL